MRIVPGFLIRQIAGETVAIPSGAAAHQLSGLVILNGAGRILFDLLQKEQTLEQLTAALTDRYEVDRKTAEADVLEFIQTLRLNHMLLEDAGNV